jgi:hypothetical protein
MGIKLNSGRHHYIKRINVFLIMMALIAGMMGCGPGSDPGPDAPLPYALNISSTAGGYVTVTVEGEETVIGPGETEIIFDIPAGTDVDLVASSDEGYEFTEWTGGPINGVVNPVTTIDMQDNYEITAVFGEMTPVPTYDLSMAANPEVGGTATDMTDGSPYAEGTTVNIEAVANLGYRFVNWTAPAGVFGNANTAETTFTMPGQAVTVTANFELIPTYELTMAVSPMGSGTATDMTDGSPYAEGTTVNIEAVPNPGYRFVNWTAPAGVFGNANEAETTFIMPGQAVTVTANFDLIPTYQLTMAVSPTGSGAAIDMTGGSPYAEGTIVSIKAQANQGYDFVNWTAPAGVFGNANQAETTFTMPGQAVTVTANFEVEPMVAAGGYHTVGLEADGTVVATGLNTNGQCNIGAWDSIIQLAAGGYHTVGLETGGTVVAVGMNTDGQCDVTGWTNIVQVAAGNKHTVGLKSDGTLVAAGDNSYGQCEVTGWTDIVQVAAGYRHTVGLKSDGTVVAVGDDYFGQCSVGGWEDIIQVAAGGYHTIGLESDGTVVAVGWNDFGQCGVGSWANIIQITAGYYHTAGVKSDGSVVAVGLDNNGQCNVSNWEGIVQIAAGYYHTVGLQSNGSVVAVGLNTDGQCDVGDWNLS